MSTPNYTTEIPRWGHRLNWEVTAPGISCKADAVDALVYQFEGHADRVLAWDEEHAATCLGLIGISELEQELREAEREVRRLEDDLEEAEYEVEDIRRKLKQAKAAGTPQRVALANYPTLL